MCLFSFPNCISWICSHLHQLKRTPSIQPHVRSELPEQSQCHHCLYQNFATEEEAPRFCLLFTVQLITTVTRRRPRFGRCCWNTHFHINRWRTGNFLFLFSGGEWEGGGGASSSGVCWLLTFLAHSNNTSSKPLFAEFNVLHLWMKAWRNAHSASRNWGLPTSHSCVSACVNV